MPGWFRVEGQRVRGLRVGERDRDRERERQTDRQTETETETETELREAHHRVHFVGKVSPRFAWFVEG